MSVAKKTRTGTTYAFPRTLRNSRALCATCSTSGKPSSSRTDISMCYFLWQFVPADPVAHVGPELPLHRLGCTLGDRLEFPCLGERVMGSVRWHQAGPLGDQ